ncbi:MAG: transcription elongation factor NusA [Candidatus Aenigmatarchaeota archaeon]|nr:MAG: transcription elongation factor NusA [Candidatus Aenigmarchaeota archaeon]
MKSPLCEVCLKNEDILCAGCQRKLDTGEITHTEIEISRILYSLKDKFKSIEAGGFKSAREVDNIILLIVPKGVAGKMIGKGGTIITTLQERLGKRIKIVEEGTVEDVAKELLGKTTLVGINKVFGADGERYKLRVKRRSAPPQLRKEEVEAIVRAVTGKKAEVVFE